MVPALDKSNTKEDPMPTFTNVMEVLKLLERSNCRRCNEKTCLAFAASVFGGRRPLSDCPQVDPALAARYAAPSGMKSERENDIDAQLAELRSRLRDVDLAAAAKRIGAVYDGRQLIVKVMGKAFGVDGAGTVYTDIHANPWVTAPVINYILSSRGRSPTGSWVPLRELPSGGDWYRLFGQRCEKPMKKIADAYPDLFGDLVDLFNGQPAGGHFQADVALILHPLPLVPLLICYNAAEEGMASDLNLFFDATAEDNLGIGGIYTLGAGITRMFERLALRHGHAIN